MHVQWGFLLVLSSNLSEKHVHWVNWWSSTFVVLTSKPQIKSHMFFHYHYMKCCVVCTSITSSNLHELIKCLDYCTDILNYPFINEIQALSKCNKKQRTIKFKNPQISSFKFIVNIIWNSQHCQGLCLRYCLMNWCAPVVQTQELLKYCSHDLSPFDNAGLREVKLSTSIKYLPKYLYLKNWQSTWQFESNNKYFIHNNSKLFILTNSILKLPQTIKCLPQDWNSIHMINAFACKAWTVQFYNFPSPTLLQLFYQTFCHWSS